MAKVFGTCSRASLLSGTTLLLSTGSPLAAQEARGGVEIRIGAEAVSNPFLNEEDSDFTAATTAEIRPWWRSESEATTFNLEAFAQGRAFADDYELEDNYGLVARIRTRASEQTELNARASIHSSDSRAVPSFERFTPDVGQPASPTLPIDPTPGEDITLLGLRGRSTTIDFGAGAVIAWNPRDTLELDVGYQNLSVANQTGSDYQTYTAGAGLTHRASERTSIGLTAGLQRTVYEQSAVGNATSILGLASIAHRFNEAMTLDASVGLASTSIETTAVRPGRNHLSVATETSLCSARERRRWCLDFRRVPQPTVRGGVRNSDSVGFTLNEQLSERDRLTVGANYSRSGAGGETPVIVPGVEFASVRTRLEHSFNRRLDGFVFGSISRIYRDNLSAAPSVNFGAGIRIRLGARR